MRRPSLWKSTKHILGCRDLYVCYCSHHVELLVQSALGGQWRFPLQFVATEAVPDDTIIIEAAGLNKESSVGFRLNSQTRY